MKQKTNLTLILITIAMLAAAGAAQTRRVAGTPKSLLTGVALPAGMIKIERAEIPSNTTEELVNLLVTINNDSEVKWRQGSLEAFYWSAPGQNRSKSEILIEKITAGLKTGGLTYEEYEDEDPDLVYFSLDRAKPAARKFACIFSVTDNSLLLVIAELASLKEAVVKTTPVQEPAVKVPNVAGKWNMIVEAQGQTIPISLELTQTGDTFSGSFTSHIGDGTVRGGKITGNSLIAAATLELSSQSVGLRFAGTIVGNEMKGTLSESGASTIFIYRHQGQIGEEYGQEMVGMGPFISIQYRTGGLRFTGPGDERNTVRTGINYSNREHFAGELGCDLP